MATTTATSVPSSAERIRSACIRGQALLAIADSADAAPVNAPVCHLLADGSVVVAIPVDDPVAEAACAESGVQAMLELTDHAPLRLRERVRALAWIRGLLRPVPGPEISELLDRLAVADPNPALLQVVSPRSAAHSRDVATGGGHAETSYTLLRLTPDSAVLADATGAEAVAVGELLAARPDPFCAIEAHWLHHLDSAHPEMVARLAAITLPPQLRRGQARPLAVDRYGMWLRVEAADGDRDVRLSFPSPVEDVMGLNRAVRALMGCPFLNGLQPKRS